MFKLYKRWRSKLQLNCKELRWSKYRKLKVCYCLLKTVNVAFSCCCFARDGADLFLSAYRACSTLSFPCSTHQTHNFWHCRCCWRRRCESSQLIWSVYHLSTKPENSGKKSYTVQLIPLKSFQTGRSSQTYPAFSILTETPENLCTIYQLRYDKPSVSRPTFVEFSVLCLVSQLSSNFCLKYVLNEWKVFDKFPNVKKKKGKNKDNFSETFAAENYEKLRMSFIADITFSFIGQLWTLRNSPNDQVLVHTVTLSWHYLSDEI